MTEFSDQNSSFKLNQKQTKNRLLKLDNISLDFKQEYLEPRDGNPQIANVEIEGGYKHLPSIYMFNPFTNASEFFLVDTGSEPNLINGTV